MQGPVIVLACRAARTVPLQAHTSHTIYCRGLRHMKSEIVSALTSVSILGNLYSITNDYDKPARIWFAQGRKTEDDVNK